MIYNIEKYETFIGSLLSRIPALRVKQIKRALYNCFTGMTPEREEYILHDIQRRGHILISQDGWVMSKSGYRGYCGNVESVLTMNDGCRLPAVENALKENYFDFNAVDCFWVALDMLPKSENFLVGNAPWSIVYDFEEDGEPMLYEITKIPRGLETTHREILLTLPQVTFENLKDNTTRIAILDDPTAEWKVPYVGFEYICVLDDEMTKNFSIISHRNRDEMWKDIE